VQLRDLLSAAQAARVEAWFPGAEVVTDHSWGATSTVVLRVRRPGGPDVLVKAAGPDDHHLEREIASHRTFAAALAERGLTAELLEADPEAKVAALTYLPGRLVEGTPAEQDPDTYRQAGAALALLHAQGSRRDSGFEAAADARALRWLDQPHGIDADSEARLRALLGAGERGPVTLVPTHGDWQPRNWLVHGGRVAVIDFGRGDWRPAATDLARLAAQQFAGRPDLERAFLDGYGADPRDPAGWRLVRVREAVGTAAYARMVGDADFERQGLRMVREALAAGV
jgi:hypothetical protein